MKFPGTPHLLSSTASCAPQGSPRLHRNHLSCSLHVHSLLDDSYYCDPLSAGPSDFSNSPPSERSTQCPVIGICLSCRYIHLRIMQTHSFLMLFIDPHCLEYQSKNRTMIRGILFESMLSTGTALHLSDIVFSWILLDFRAVRPAQPRPLAHRLHGCQRDRTIQRQRPRRLYLRTKGLQHGS